MSGDSTIRAAKSYLQRGWKIIQLHGLIDGKCSCGGRPRPCGPKNAGKHPVRDEWQKPLTWSKADVFAAFDDVFNIGILTGTPSGFFVLDIDPDAGGNDSMAQLVSRGRLPDTLRIRTGSGGTHIYFSMPDFDLGNGRGELKAYPGLDIRGTGGYVVAPPSVSGKGPYSVLHDHEIAPAPAWLLDMLRPKTAERLTIADVEKTTLDLPPEEALRLDRYAGQVVERLLGKLVEMRNLSKPRGEGYTGPPWNQTTFDIACGMIEIANSPWNDYGLPQAYADLFQEAPRDSGFGDATINAIWQSAMQRVGDKARPVPDRPASNRDWVQAGLEAQRLAALPTQSPTPAAAGSVAEGLSQPQTVAGGTDDVNDPEFASWQPVDLTQLLEGKHVPEEPKVLVRTDGRHLLYPGRVHSFHGESESGKSLITLAAAVPLIETGQRVAMVDFESDAAATIERLIALGAKKADIARYFDYRRPEVSFAASVTETAAWIHLLDQTYQLVIIDGVTEALTLFSTSSKDNDEVTHWVRNVPRLIARRTGAAVVMIDHVTKDADTRGRFAIGGQAKMAALDGAAYLVEVLEPIGIGMRGSIGLRVAKDRPGHVRPHSGSWRKTDRTQEASFVMVDATEKDVTTVTFEPPRASQERAEDESKETWRPTELMAVVSRYLADHGPQSKTALEQNVHGRAVYVRQAIVALIDDGFVAHDGPAINGHPTYRLVQPFVKFGDPPPV